jgi:hypothetical protein
MHNNIRFLLVFCGQTLENNFARHGINTGKFRAPGPVAIIGSTYYINEIAFFAGTEQS